MKLIAILALVILATVQAVTAVMPAADTMSNRAAQIEQATK